MESLNKQDAKYRATVVGKSQVEVEQGLIKAENGVFVLFTPTQGTPQMISENGEIPKGLIPQSRMASYETSVKPRVDTTHQMPKAGINSVFIRHQENRPQIDSPEEAVDNTHYRNLIDKNIKRFNELVISKEQYDNLIATGVPAAFYFYIPQEGKEAEYASIFAKQINSHTGNKLTDPGVYYNRSQDLKAVNNMLKTLGFKPVQDLLKVKDMTLESKLKEASSRKSTLKV